MPARHSSEGATAGRYAGRSVPCERLSIRVQLHQSPLKKLGVEFELEVVGRVRDGEIEDTLGALVRGVDEVYLIDFVVAFIPAHNAGEYTIVFECDRDVDRVV